jgi:hypothetical protein
MVGVLPGGSLRWRAALAPAVGARWCWKARSVPAVKPHSHSNETCSNSQPVGLVRVLALNSKQAAERTSLAGRAGLLAVLQALEYEEFPLDLSGGGTCTAQSKALSMTGQPFQWALPGWLAAPAQARGSAAKMPQAARQEGGKACRRYQAEAPAGCTAQSPCRSRQEQTGAQQQYSAKNMTSKSSRGRRAELTAKHVPGKYRGAAGPKYVVVLDRRSGAMQRQRNTAANTLPTATH